MNADDWFEHGRQNAYHEEFGSEDITFRSESEAAEAGSAQLAAFRSGYLYGQEEISQKPNRETER